MRILGPGPAREHRLEHSGDGVFTAERGEIPDEAHYQYVIDESYALPDPVSRYQPLGVSGPSQIVDPERFAWNDQEWKGLKAADSILYELHVGTFTDSGTFDGVVERLEYLKSLGITAIELMPVAEFPGGRNWGYDGVFLFAPQSSYGGPSGLKRLVNEAHGQGLAVILDVVYNHLGPEGNVLPRYGPYFTNRYKTPWGDAINFDGPDSDEVRKYFVDNALYWLSEYHIDGLRLDAVHAICDFSAYNILAEIKDSVRALEEQVGRCLLVIGESDLNDPRLVRSSEQGGLGLDAQWSDDFHHAVHVALTGEQQGYYADFDGVGSVAKAMNDRFVLDGVFSRFRRRRHGAEALDISGDRIVTFVQNHDQIGNRAAGDRLSTLLSFDRQKIAAFLLLMSPYVPLLFMGEEYGETNPFQYFVSHNDPSLVEAVREGRRREFESFGWSSEVPDPQAEETFFRSRLDWSRSKMEPHSLMLCLYRDLIRLKREEAPLTPGTGDVTAVADNDEQWVVWRFDDRRGATLLVAAVNLATTGRTIACSAKGSGSWQSILSTDDTRYGGCGADLTSAGSYSDSGTIKIPVPAETAILLRRTG